MKISYSWLQKYISPIPSPEETSRLLTDTGLEVENIENFETVKGSLAGLVTGKVVECKKHPQADRLSLTLVDINEDSLLQIVCGAPNVREGQQVVVAKAGTMLYPINGEPFKIKESKIRGEVSQGMICAEDEIGIGESHEGIIVLPDATPVGIPVAELFGVNKDYVLEIGLTPNRIDAASHYGTARDLRAALYVNDHVRLSIPEIRIKPDFSVPAPIRLLVENQEAVIRYSGLCIDNIKVSESPVWLKDALKSIGLKPINNIVDITNFVLHETGQPLHAFDRKQINGDTIILRTVPDGTSFITLDGIERKLSSSDLMICDAEKPMCIAGVFGGIQSGVHDNTTSIFIESATFHPVWIRKTSAAHHLKTDAAFRFERGADPEMTHYAMMRAADLILEIAGGELSPGLLDWYPLPVNWKEIRYPWRKLDRLAGTHIPRDVAKKILTLLEIQIIEEDADGLFLKIPPFKNDVTQEEDVTEEILRIYGYNRIPEPTQLRTPAINPEKPDVWKMKNRISDHLVSLGFSEILTNSLSDYSLTKLIDTSESTPINILNPLSSELNSLRTFSFAGLCETISWNKNRQQHNLSMFEWGKTYHRLQKKTIEKNYLAIAQSGNTGEEDWNRAQVKSSYFTIKGSVESVFSLINIQKDQVIFKPEDHAVLNESVAVFCGQKKVGIIGSISKEFQKHFDLESEIWVAELNWDEMLSIHKGNKFFFHEISKFPSVRRDLSLLLDSSIAFSQLVSIARNSERKFLRDVQLFDVYQGKNLPPGKKSYAISFVFMNEEKTLTDDQINLAMERLIKSFKDELGADLR